MPPPDHLNSEPPLKPQIGDNSYQYSDLSEGRNEIRILTLHPGSSERIRLTLKNAVLQEKPFPQYEALSYAWGSEDDKTNINIGDGDDTIAVPRNLLEALWYLRDAHETRMFWIDAICVNQRDLEERSRQVRRMSAIFRRAERVVVWLGPPDETSRAAIKTLHSIGSRTTINWVTCVASPSWRGDPELTHLRQACHQPAAIDGLTRLVSRPWFDRLWVLQEINLAKEETAVVACGHDLILWNDLPKGLWWLRWWSHDTLDKTLKTRINETIYSVRLKDITLIDAFLNTGRAKCSDPRDRVYAILSLLNLEENIIVDYNKPPSHVYTDFMVQLLEQMNNIHLLACCEYADHSLAPIQVPSWVANWTRRLTAALFPTACADLGSSAFASCTSDGVLEASGVLCGRVVSSVSFTPILTRTSSLEDFVTAVQALVPQNPITDTTYIGGGSLLEAYCRTLCANLFAETLLPIDDNYPEFERSMHVLSCIMDNEFTSDLQAGAQDYITWCNIYCEGRKLVRTGEGYIGLAPTATREDDIICVILGCQTPLVLRQCGDGSFQVIGSCYLHGFMSGEALLSPLPANVKYVLREEDGLEWFRYLDTKTRKILPEDPRFGSDHQESIGDRNETPDQNIGDEKTSVPERSPPENHKYRNHELYREPDPRISPDALRKRGVDVQTFKLV